MASYIDKKTGPKSYKVNVLNSRGKEVWRYVKSLKSARKAQEKAESKGISSSIYRKINDGEYESI